MNPCGVILIGHGSLKQCWIDLNWPFLLCGPYQTLPLTMVPHVSSLARIDGLAWVTSHKKKTMIWGRYPQYPLLKTKEKKEDNAGSSCIYASLKDDEMSTLES
jgi:hypothetical protein